MAEKNKATKALLDEVQDLAGKNKTAVQLLLESKSEIIELRQQNRYFREVISDLNDEIELANNRAMRFRELSLEE